MKTTWFHILAKKYNKPIHEIKTWYLSDIIEELIYLNYQEDVDYSIKEAIANERR